MDVSTKAKELGEAIQATEEFKNLSIADANYQNSEEAQKLTEDYNSIRGELVKKAQAEDVSPQEMMEIRQTLGLEFAKLEQNAVIKAYIEAKKDFDGIMAEVDGIIKFYVTGEEPGGCGEGGCNSCSGCH